eukprot:TRINITY_DN4201_c0_g1_i2.p1 TRINITY_DN4201_c0_g1~~TRINITY_DN4201_c0_g1_i2.p1  ORF type:complete len:227 (+),score=43.44 TRINITY_DN4201_c0_g1_i2:25-705(+)
MENTSKIESALKNLWLLSDEDKDWYQFIAEEIESNINTVKSCSDLLDILETHLQDIGQPQKEGSSLNDVAQQLFDQLVKDQIIKKEKTDDDEENEKETLVENDVPDEEDGASVGEGCCVICTREMPLTKHHLIPREVHELYKKRYQMTKEQLHTGIMVCRSCHSALHSFIDNKSMASDYNTLEKIMEHPKVINWIPYIMKRRTTSKADKRTWVQRHPTGMPPDDDE